MTEYPAHKRLYNFEMADDLDFYALRAEFESLQRQLKELRDKTIELCEFIDKDFRGLDEIQMRKQSTFKQAEIVMMARQLLPRTESRAMSESDGTCEHGWVGPATGATHCRKCNLPKGIYE